MRPSILIGLVLLTTTPLGAQQPPKAEATMRFGALRPGSEPYRSLFATPRLPNDGVKPATPLQPPQATDQRRPQPKIVCGMLMIPADPSIDPKMRVTPRQNPNLEYKMRVVEPPTCNAAK